MAITKEQVISATGSGLDKLVALALGHKAKITEFGCEIIDWNKVGTKVNGYRFEPHKDGTQCMEIMEQEKIACFIVFCIDGTKWETRIRNIGARGDTAMIAICRCFVLSKLEVINGN